MYASEYADFLIKCFQQLSIQIPLFTTTVSLLSNDEPEFVDILRQRLETQTLEAIRQDDVATVKLLLKAIACLASAQCLVVDANAGLIAVLKPLLSVCEAAIANENMDEQALVSFYLLFHTVLWCPDVLANDADGKNILEGILASATHFRARYRSVFGVNGIQAIVTRFLPPEEGDEEVARLSVAPSANDPLNPSGADNVWELAFVVEASLSEMRASGGSFNFASGMIVPWKRVVDSTKAPTLSFSAEFSSELFDLLQHKSLGARSRKVVASGLSTLTLGDAANVGRTTAWLRSRYPIFAADTNAEAAACSSLSALERATALSYFQDVIQFFDPVVHQNGAKYGSVDLLMGHLLATFKLFPAEAHLEYLLVEYLFQLLLQPPINSAQHIMVSRILLHLFKHHAEFQPVIGLATNILFQLVPDLDVTVIRAFADWFVFHFQNTGFLWPAWDFWTSSCALNADGTTKVDVVGDVAQPALLDSDTLLTRLFCHCVTQKASKLVSFDRLKTAIPAAFHQFFDYDETPKCSFFSADARAPDANPSATGHAYELKKLVEERVDSEEILDWMENLPQLTPEGNEKILGAMMLQTICIVGAQSETMTAFIGLLDIYGKVLRELGDGEAQQLVTAKTIFDAFSHHAGLVAFLFGEMLHRGLVSASALATVLAEDVIVRGLAVEPVAFKLYEVVVDHVLGVFREAVVQRNRLGGGLVLDENADLIPSEEPVYVSVGQPSAAMESDLGNGIEEELPAPPTRTQEEEDAQVDFNEDEDADGRRLRRRTGDEEDENGIESRRQMSIESTNSGVNYEERELDPLWIASEATKVAVKGGRAVFRTLVTALASLWHEDVAVTDEIVALRAVAKSLLGRIWRSYGGLETHLEHQLAQRVVVADNGIHAEVARLLISGGEEAFVQSWSRFLQH